LRQICICPPQPAALAKHYAKMSDESPQLISDIRASDARKEHIKLILDQLVEKFESIKLMSYEYNDIGTPYIGFGFQIDDTYRVQMKVTL